MLHIDEGEAEILALLKRAPNLEEVSVNDG
jgi:hypothetical protein